MIGAEMSDKSGYPTTFSYTPQSCGWLPMPLRTQILRSQSCPARDRNRIMLRLLLLIHLVQHTCTYVTDSPSFAYRLDKLYEKLEKLTVSPPNKDSIYIPPEDLLAKIDRLNSLNPEEKDLTEDDEELLAAMQIWGMLTPEQLEGVVKDLQGLKNEDRSEKLTDGEYADADWMDEELQDIAEGDYPMDANEEWDDVDVEGSTSKPTVVTPSAFTRQEVYHETLSAVDPIAATNERPKILDDSSLTPIEKAALRRAALSHISSVVRSSKCFTPQPRWLSVRQLAPAADTVYMPPCVQLHRCAPDSGCCYNEGEVCAPVEGNHVNIPFYLNKADGNFSVARMRFFNHTRCACVSRDTLQGTVRSYNPRHSIQVRRESQKENVVREVQSDWKSTEEPRLERDEEPTAPPQLRRCTCPGLFLARMTDDTGVCSCVCDWPDPYKRRDCLSLARGREHFGLRDRVCVAHGDCNPPACEYGAYERSSGRCPLRRYRRIRYHRARLDKTIV